MCSEVAVLCCAKPPQVCLSLCDPIDHSPPGPTVHGIPHASIMEWGIFPTQGLNPSLMSSALVGEFFTTRAT